MLAVDTDVLTEVFQKDPDGRVVGRTHQSIPTFCQPR